MKSIKRPDARKYFSSLSAEQTFNIEGKGQALEISAMGNPVLVLFSAGSVSTSNFDLCVPSDTIVRVPVPSDMDGQLVKFKQASGAATAAVTARRDS